MFKKNTAVTGFGIGHFINATTGAVVTTGTPTCKRTLDGTGGACANAAAYDSDGAVWKINLDASDMNGDTVVLSFTLTDCLPISYTIRTGTKLVSELNDLGGTAQTGDVYAIANSGTHGNAALKTLIDTVDTVVDAIKAITDDLADGARIDLLIDAIKAKTDNLKASWNDLDAAGVRTALGMASANLDTQLGGILGYVDCLPASWVVPATAAEVAAVQTHGDSTWATATGFSTHSAADVKTAMEAAGSHLAELLSVTEVIA